MRQLATLLSLAAACAFVMLFILLLELAQLDRVLSQTNRSLSKIEQCLGGEEKTVRQLHQIP